MKWKLMAVLGLLLGCAVVATAGPAWVEGGDGDDDAGSLPGNAQVTVGGAVMLTISGSLDGAAAANGVADFEDMYVIQIDDPDSFSATTAFFPGSTEFDSRLFLFRVDPDQAGSGLGLLGNEDTGGPPPLLMRLGDYTGACCFGDGTCEILIEMECTAQGGVYQGDFTDCKSAECSEWYGACCVDEGECYEDFYTYCLEYGGIFLGDGTDCESDECPDPDGSTMGNGATDGSGAMVSEPGIYYLAITVTPRDPVSSMGPIFEFTMLNEVSGPDGPGGDEPISSWSEPPPEITLPVGFPGNYTILLGGTGFAQSECQWDLNGDGYVTLHDAFELFNAWGPCPPDPEPCPADFTGDGVVDWADLSDLFGNLGPCPVDNNCPPDFNGDLVVDVQDLAEMLEHFGNCPAGEPCPWDLNGNGHVCIGDMLILLTNWGPCP
jgi:hypothetical protein